MSLSPELARFLRHVSKLPAHDPPHADDAADLLNSLTDADLARICVAPAGPRVCRYNPVLWKPALAYSSELRARLSEELDELELNLSADNQEGWLEEVLR